MYLQVTQFNQKYAAMLRDILSELRAEAEENVVIFTY